LVEQEMQLIKRRAGDLPVMFLVQISEGDRVGRELVEVVDALLARLFGQRNRHPDQMPKRLNLMGLLMGERRGPLQDRFGVEGGFRHMRASSAASKTLCSPFRTRFRNRAFPKICDVAGFAYD